MPKQDRRLSDQVKAFIVTRLAMFHTPMEVVRMVKEEFGLELPRQQVHSYDPNRVNYQSAKKWADLYYETRQRYTTDVFDVALAHKAVRLRELERLYRKAFEMGNLMMASNLLEQAAKEVGGIFSNRREIGGIGGGPIETKNQTELTGSLLSDLSGLSDQELRKLREIDDKLAAASEEPTDD